MDYLETLLQKAISEAEARGKEPFDYPRFTKLYFHDTGGCERLKPDDELSHAYYRRMYYTDYPQIMTVAEYADFLNRLDLDS